MNMRQFNESLRRERPPAQLDPALKALWLDAKGDWESAHTVVQQQRSTAAAWVHAYLHRKEGDHANAGYWYARAGRQACSDSLDEEWSAIARALLLEAG